MRRGQERIALAIQPTCRGFGFAVMELAADRLITYGLRQVKASEMEVRSLPKIAELIEQHAPSIVIVEDTAAAAYRRRGKGRALIDGIIEAAELMTVAVGRVSSARVGEFFADLGAKNKDAIAGLIAEWFPELRPVLPPIRRFWHPKFERMTIFEAIALATVFAGDNPSLLQNAC